MKRKYILIITFALLLCELLMPKSTNLVSAKQLSQQFIVVKNTMIVDGQELIAADELCAIANAKLVMSKNSKKAKITKDYLTIHLTAGDSRMKFDGGYDDYLSVAPKVSKGKLMIPLDEVAKKLGCVVKRDKKSKKTKIQPSDGIITTNIWNTSERAVSNWASVSSVHEFLYKEEGLAFAFQNKEKLIITTPNRTLELKMKYPRLGDVISDTDGNLYIVWGQEGSKYTDKTVFISKYSATGEHIKTTGFEGESKMGEDGNTKIPFNHGNCIATIGDGKLMVNYARTMYNGHQSNNVIGVNILDMSPVEYESKWDIPYTSHSFNQSAIWSDKYNDFIYADHGDAYGRGFVVTTDRREDLLFNFYLEPNANYNMYIVNRTFAQLGNLAETSEGVVLVGASAKSVSKAAKSEKQNLFIQLFDPFAELSSSKFIGGEERVGKTSMNINDNSNTPLTKVTDYGVHWLTNYTDKDVIAPQVVEADNRLVILWTTKKDSFYMILSQNGELIKPETSLKGVPLNSFERPVYFKGTIYWMAVKDGVLKEYRLKVK